MTKAKRHAPRTTKLTDKAVQNFKPEADRYEVPDSTSGVRLCVYPSGAKSWCCRFYVSGKLTKYTIGSYPEIGLAAARKLAGKVFATAAEGVDPQARKIAERRDSFATVAALYVERRIEPECRPRTVGETKRYLAMAAAAWPGRPIASIKHPDLVRLLDQVEHQRGRSSSNRLRSVLVGLLNWAADRAHIDPDKVPRIPKPHKEAARDRVLSDDELRQVWLAAGGLEYPRGPFIKMLILTGCRRNEIAALEWSEIDVQGRVVRLPAKRVKNNRPHEVPLSEAAIAVLQDVPRITGRRWVFGKRPLQAFGDLKRSIDKLVPDLRPWVFHDVRRTVATRMCDIGIAPHIVEAVINHVSGHKAGVAGVYNRSSYAPEKIAALERWANHVISLVEGKPDNVVAMMKRA